MSISGVLSGDGVVGGGVVGTINGGVVISTTGLGFCVIVVLVLQLFCQLFPFKLLSGPFHLLSLELPLLEPFPAFHSSSSLEHGFFWSLPRPWWWWWWWWGLSQPLCGGKPPGDQNGGGPGRGNSGPLGKKPGDCFGTNLKGSKPNPGPSSRPSNPPCPLRPPNPPCPPCPGERFILCGWRSRTEKSID